MMLTAAPAVTAGPLPPAAWAVDYPRSRIGFSATMNSAPFAGSFARWAAQISFDPARLAQSRVVARIETASARTGDASRDEALPTDDWFAVRQFPAATFTSTRIRAAGPGRYVADGQLVIRGAARPVSLPFALTIAGSAATMRGVLTIDRRAFGVGRGQFASTETVGAGVRVEILINARKLR